MVEKQNEPSGFKRWAQKVVGVVMLKGYQLKQRIEARKNKN